jgi:hypothetical protein
MSRKHYIAVAERIRRIDTRPAREQIAHDMADIFAEDNPRFDRARFLEACGVTDG